MDTPFLHAAPVWWVHVKAILWFLWLNICQSQRRKRKRKWSRKVIVSCETGDVHNTKRALTQYQESYVIFCMFSVYCCHISAQSTEWEPICWFSLSRSVSNLVTLCCNAIRFLSALPCVCWCFLLRFLRSDHSSLLVNHKQIQCAQLLLDSLSPHVTISLFSVAY